MKKVLRIISIVLAVISLGLFITGIILRKNGYTFNYEFWSEFQSYWIEFGLLGLFSYVYLMLKFELKSIRVGLSVFAFLSCMLLGFLSLFETESLTTLENENQTIYITGYHFLRGGTDTVYQKQNGFISKYIDEFTTDESYRPTYELVGDILIVTTEYSSDNIEVEELILD